MVQKPQGPLALKVWDEMLVLVVWADFAVYWFSCRLGLLRSTAQLGWPWYFRWMETNWLVD